MGWRQPDPSAEGSYADRPLEVAAPLEVGGHLRSSQLVQGDAVAPGVRNEQHGPWGISKLCCRSQPRAASATKAAPRSATRYTRIGRSPSTWSANSTSGGPSVNWTAATRVPIASTANTTRPPKTSLKYPRSPATSVLGVYTKSSCWNGVDWSVTAARAGQRGPAWARSPPGTRSNGAAGSSSTPSDRISKLRRRECAPALKV